MTKCSGETSQCEAQPRSEARENFTPVQQPEWSNISRQCLADNSVWQAAKGTQTGGDPTFDKSAMSSGFLQFGNINELTNKTSFDRAMNTNYCRPGDAIAASQGKDNQLSVADAVAKQPDNSPQAKAASLFNKDVSDEQKIATIRDLANSGVKNLSYKDDAGKEHKLRLETIKAGSNQMVHLYVGGAGGAGDGDGREKIALRGISKADGSIERARDSRGNFVDYQAKGYAQIGAPQGDSIKAEDKASKGLQREAAKTGEREAPKTKEATRAREGAEQVHEAKPGTIDRSRFDAELKDPRVMAAFAGRLHSEVGSQGAAAHLAFAEKVMNRATSRNQTLMQALSGSYYPTHHPGRSNNPKYIEAITKAWKEGTDTTLGATGNASGKVGFGKAGGHYDKQGHWVSPNQTVRINGERFGYEQVDINKGWLKKYEQLKQPRV